MPIEGPLTELGIQDVLQLLDLTRKTGVLVVRSERNHDEATIWFDRGAIVAARRRRSLRKLGQQLLRAGKLTERELERALQQQKTGLDDRRIGELLLEQGSVEEADLEQHLRFQIDEAVYDLMSWEEGEFRFEERPETAPENFPVRIKVETVLMEGARRIDEWSRLEDRIPNLEAIPMLNEMPDTGSPIDLRPDEWEVVAEIDGTRDIRQLAADLGRSSFDVAKIIFGLLTTGVITVEESAQARRAGRPLDPALDELRKLIARGEFDAAVKLAEELGHAYPEHGVIPLLGGRAMMGQGRVRAATEAFAKAVALDPLEPEAHYHFGFAAVQIGDFGRAEHAWGNYLRLTPNGGRRTIVAQALEAVRSLNRILDTNTKLSLS